MEHVLALEEVKVDIEEQIQFFPGYENPFWYEKKKDYKQLALLEQKAREKLEWEKTRPNSTFAGTQPDIEIRWRYH